MAYFGILDLLLACIVFAVCHASNVFCICNLTILIYNYVPYLFLNILIIGLKNV